MQEQIAFQLPPAVGSGKHENLLPIRFIPWARHVKGLITVLDIHRHLVQRQCVHHPLMLTPRKHDTTTQISHMRFFYSFNTLNGTKSTSTHTALTPTG